MLIVTAGVVRVRLARTTMPLESVERAGTSVDGVKSGCAFDRVRIEPADGAVRFDEQLARNRVDLLEGDRRNSRAEILEHVDARDRLEIADLMRDVGDAVVLEHQPRVQL